MDYKGKAQTCCGDPRGVRSLDSTAEVSLDSYTLHCSPPPHPPHYLAKMQYRAASQFAQKLISSLEISNTATSLISNDNINTFSHPLPSCSTNLEEGFRESKADSQIDKSDTV